ncbi:hypothetical protein VNI00_012777 [Paramarasmius palmivorus]|uniref:Uncharacterized protein n=1 Tax=Paramarasmius palmivorus TaxID=297713 RepID=A0AAW0C505_9AGAR
MEPLYDGAELEVDGEGEYDCDLAQDETNWEAEGYDEDGVEGYGEDEDMDEDEDMYEDEDMEDEDVEDDEYLEGDEYLKDEEDIWQDPQYSGEWVLYDANDSIRRIAYFFNPEWRDVLPARTRTFRSRFTIRSGEMVWGQLLPILIGMKTHRHDQPGGDAIYFRVPAKVGVWNIATVKPYRRYLDRSMVAYHSSLTREEVVALLRKAQDTNYFPERREHPDVCYVERYGWGCHFDGANDAVRTFADIDPGAGWVEAIRRRREGEDDELYDASYDDLYGEERTVADSCWMRLERLRIGHTFLMDADNAPQVVKLLARPSRLDVNMKRQMHTSLFATLTDQEPFGCNLSFIGSSDWEHAKLIFSEEPSQRFPGKRELLAFWYDDRQAYYRGLFPGLNKIPVPVIVE